MSTKAIFLDLDGTLVNSLEDLTAAMNNALNSLGLAGHTTDECCKMIGNGLRKFASRAIPADKQELTDDVISLVRSYYKKHYLDNTKPYDDIEILTKSLREKGIKLFVVTNKDQDLARGIIKGLFETGLFDGVYGASSEFPLKPSPELPIHIMKGNKLAASEIIFVGDSAVDIETAKAGSFTAVGVSWGLRDRGELIEAGADHVIDKPLELLELVS